MVYITLSNAKRIVFNKTELKTLNLNGQVYEKPIYFFSYYEKNSLLAIKELLKDPEKFFTEIYKPIHIKDTYRFVFKEKKPAYHYYLECERLQSDFQNYEIPEKIRKKGIDEIMRFRKWFIEHKHLLDRPDVFAMRMELAFGISVNPKAINYENSGCNEIENLNLDELRQKIDTLLKEAGRYFYQSEKNKTILNKFSKYTFLAYRQDEIRINDTEYQDEEIKRFLRDYNERFKKPLKKMLIEYYRIKHNPELKLEGYLLEQLGFRPCRHCHENKFETDKMASCEKEEKWFYQSNTDIIFKNYPRLN